MVWMSNLWLGLDVTNNTNYKCIIVVPKFLRPLAGGMMGSGISHHTTLDAWQLTFPPMGSDPSAQVIFYYCFRTRVRQEAWIICMAISLILKQDYFIIMFYWDLIGLFYYYFLHRNYTSLTLPGTKLRQYLSLPAEAVEPADSTCST